MLLDNKRKINGIFLKYFSWVLERGREGEKETLT